MGRIIRGNTLYMNCSRLFDALRSTFGRLLRLTARVVLLQHAGILAECHNRGSHCGTVFGSEKRLGWAIKC